MNVDREANSSSLFNFARDTRFQWACIALLIGIACTLFIYREQIANGFSVLSGDPYDTVISASILEHWHRFYSGYTSWSNADYFYPYKDTIAQTDGYFLASIPYQFLRMVGLDPLLSQEGAGMILRLAGFLFFYLFCRRTLALRRSSSIMGAIFFVMADASSSYIYRIQFDSLAFAPLLAMWIFDALKAAREDNSRDFILFGCLAAFTFSAWCLTCFYLAWFFVYFAIVFTIIYGACAPSEIAATWTKLFRHWAGLITILIVCLVFLSPFLHAYVSKAMQVGVRHWSDVVPYLISPAALALMRPDSLGRALVDHAVAPFASLPSAVGEYSQIGFSPVVVVALLVALFLSLRTKTESLPKWSAKAVVLTIIFCSIGVVTIDGHSIWRVVYAVVPGAKALRVASSIFIFLVFPTAAVVGWLTDRVRPPSWLFPIWVLGFIILEVNTPALALNRRAELALFDVPPPKMNCRTFYIGPLPEQIKLGDKIGYVRSMYSHNVAAMYIAQIVGIPTINGIASFDPPDWDFGYPARPDYDERAEAYVRRHKLIDVCRLDIAKKSWKRMF